MKAKLQAILGIIGIASLMTVVAPTGLVHAKSATACTWTQVAYYKYTRGTKAFPDILNGDYFYRGHVNWDSTIWWSPSCNGYGAYYTRAAEWEDGFTFNTYMYLATSSWYNGVYEGNAIFSGGNSTSRAVTWGTIYVNGGPNLIWAQNTSGAGAKSYWSGGSVLGTYPVMDDSLGVTYGQSVCACVRG